MSYLNVDSDVYEETYNNLAPEDIEFILQETAVDTDILGVDSLTGYGIIDAGSAMARID